ncbi:hypothetical protein D9756_006472 [Leucocoprinus leucothites]|uniref:AB hydrolase-1 domain-containing protein n=1 Tax=Leucocoprinus leucothites TaxID=201217 RepID=A0A8H5LHA5_9AGAR|nr:hypothetical protein D9756_006472 [Leucoagaricus leucothites]
MATPFHSTVPVVASLPAGIELTYFDSGPVVGSTSFTTLVLVHGCHFNSYGFKHLIPIAPQVNLRLVLVQRRDYAGSSKYTDDEMSVLRSDNPTAFFGTAGEVMAQFVHYLVSNTEVCTASEDRSSGGIAIAGWSIGNVFAQSMFFEGATLNEETYAAIEPYVLSLVLYDPPHCAFGIPTPPTLMHMFDPFHIKDPEESKQKFRRWVSSYYDHDTEPDVLELSNLDSRLETEQCVFKSWTPALQEERTEDFPLRSDAIVISKSVAQHHINRMSNNALFALNPRRFPLARVSFVHGKRSIWMCAFARHSIKRKYLELLSQGQKDNIRSFHFIDSEEGNHFVGSHYVYALWLANFKIDPL